MELAAGAVIAGRYRVVRLVGTGGMGEVWAGEYIGAGGPRTRVALKRLLPAAAQHHEVVTRFRREAVLLGRIQSAHVAKVIDFIEDDLFGLVLAMELIEGRSLASVLEERNLTVEEALPLASDLARALCDLHEAKIVHRDLKPGNIIMKPLGDGRTRAVVVDFGIGRQLSSNDNPDEITGITRANIALGTVEYMAPEQILNSRDVTPLTDIYAVGAILFRAVAGVHAFGARRGEELARTKLIEEPKPLEIGRNDEVFRGFAEVVARSLRKRPALRYASAAEMLAALEAVTESSRASMLDLDDTTNDGPPTRVPAPARTRTERPMAPPPLERPQPQLERPQAQLERPPPRREMPSYQELPRGPMNAGARASVPEFHQPVQSTTQHMGGRGSLPSIPEIALGGSSLPSSHAPNNPESQRHRGMPDSQRQHSMPEMRGAMASLPSLAELAPRSVAEPPRRGVPGGTMLVGMVAALAMGVATGLFVGPLVRSGTEPTALPPKAPASSAAALVCPPAPTCPAIECPAVPVPTATTPPKPKVAPALTGRLNPLPTTTAWIPPMPSSTATSTPGLDSMDTQSP